MAVYGNLITSASAPRTKRDIAETFKKWGISHYDVQLSLREAAVMFSINGRDQVFRCDRFDDAETNLRAIYLTLEPTRLAAQRGILEELASLAVAMLPAGKFSRPAWEVLGISQDSQLDVAETVWRMKAKTSHPDKGGTEEQMTELNEALDWFKAQVKRPA